jgi:hypothetical protein
MRDRLIELLQNAPSDYAGNKGVGAIADHLLANGVIVPPCKVGDMLYLPISHRVIVYEVSAIKYDGDLLKIVTHNILSGKQRTIWAMDVGTTIFRTHKEAGQALKGGAE